jgi:hypothetical protein
VRFDLEVRSKEAHTPSRERRQETKIAFVEIGFLRGNAYEPVIKQHADPTRP